jgi:hypothetical protein
MPWWTQAPFQRNEVRPGCRISGSGSGYCWCSRSKLDRALTPMNVLKPEVEN